MHNIPKTEVSPQLQNLVQQAISTHEPVKFTIDHGQTVILLAEQDGHQSPDIFNQIKAIMTKSQPPKMHKQRVFGSSKGLIKMATDFDAPLNDFKDYT